jgi:hypothetical protein
MNLLLSDYDEPNDDYGYDDAFGCGFGLDFDGESLDGIDAVLDDYAIPGNPASCPATRAQRRDSQWWLDGELGGSW